MTRQRLIWTLWLVLGMGLMACTATHPHPPARPSSRPSVKVKPPSTPVKPGHTRPYKVDGQWYQPMADAQGFRQQGKASWYGRKFHGRRTSNGEVYDMYAVTAAHKTLPFGTRVTVRNLDNGRSVEVRINDRGPFVAGRVIDLSYTAAKQIGMVGPGTARVELFATAGPSGQRVDLYAGDFTFQVGAFQNRDNAARLVKRLKQQFENVHMVPYTDGQNKFYRVRVGQVTHLKQAAQFEQRLVQAGFQDAFVVAQ